MEYYSKCNICNFISCYNDDDLNEYESHLSNSGLFSFAALTNALCGGMYNSFEFSKLSAIEESKKVNLTRCSKCGSRDISYVTKNYAKLSYKNNSCLDKETLLNEAERSFKEHKYLDAISFSHDYLEDKKALMIHFLSSMEVDSINDLENSNKSIIFYNYLEDVLNIVSLSEKEIINNVYDKDKKEYDLIMEENKKREEEIKIKNKSKLKNKKKTRILIWLLVDFISLLLTFSFFNISTLTISFVLIVLTIIFNIGRVY